MKTTTITFKNHPTKDGGVEDITIPGCLIANNGSPTSNRPEILIHIPKTHKDKDVSDSWVVLGESEYHVVGVTRSFNGMDSNVPTDWDRYAIAERII